MKVTRERKITLRYKEAGASQRATLVIEVTAEEDDLPHEHRHDLKETAAELLGVPLESLPEGVEVELKHPKAHSPPHPNPPPKPSEETSQEKAKV